MSLQERALKLAYEARDDIFKTESSVTSIIRKCYTICQLLKKDVDWIKNELYGYGYNKTFGELYEIIPSYRIVNLYYVEYNDRLLYGSNKELRKYPLPTSISNIEKSKNGDITIVRKLDEYIEAPVKISNYYVTNILNFVKNRSLEFLNEIILELEYGNISSNIFNDYKKKIVDEKLIEICPRAIESLTKNYKDLAQSSESITWSQIAFSCRDILQDFTDSIYKLLYLREGEHKPSREQIKKKLKLTLEYILSGFKNTEKELIEIQIDNLNKYIDKLNELIQKNVHIKIKKEDANRCVIYTYLLIGDILKLLSEKI